MTAGYGEAGNERFQRFRLAVQRHACRRCFFHHGRILLGDLIHLGDGGIDFLETDRLLAGGGRNLPYQLVDLQNLIGDLSHRLAGLADQLDALAHLP